MAGGKSGKRNRDTVDLTGDSPEPEPEPKRPNTGNVDPTPPLKPQPKKPKTGKADPSPQPKKPDASKADPAPPPKPESEKPSTGKADSSAPLNREDAPIAAFNQVESDYISDKFPTIQNPFDYVGVTPPLIPKVTKQCQGSQIEVYPDYGKDDLLPVMFAGDDPNTDFDKRNYCGPKYKGMSCAIDTFLWVLQTCSVRRVRCDSISLPADIAKLNNLSQLLLRYLRLPLNLLSQAQIDTCRDSIRDLVALNEDMRYDPQAGMDIANLFEYALRDNSLQQLSFTLATVRLCNRCSATGIRRATDAHGITSSRNVQDPKPSPQDLLQDYFDPSPVPGQPKCQYCDGAPLTQHMILDRMPDLLIWQDGPQYSSNTSRDYSMDINLDVTYVTESTENGVVSHELKKKRVVYRPVTFVFRVRGGRGVPHWYAATIAPPGSHEHIWTVYDGQGRFEANNASYPQCQILLTQDLEREMDQSHCEVYSVVLRKQSEKDYDRLTYMQQQDTRGPHRKPSWLVQYEAERAALIAKNS